MKSDVIVNFTFSRKFLMKFCRAINLWTAKDFKESQEVKEAEGIKYRVIGPRVVKLTELYNLYLDDTGLTMDQVNRRSFSTALKDSFKLKRKRRAEGVYLYPSPETGPRILKLLKDMKATDYLHYDGNSLEIYPDFQIGNGKNFDKRESIGPGGE